MLREIHSGEGAYKSYSRRDDGEQYASNAFASDVGAVRRCKRLRSNGEEYLSSLLSAPTFQYLYSEITHTGLLRSIAKQKPDARLKYEKTF